MVDHPNRAPTNPDPPLPPVRSSAVGRMVSSQQEIGSRVGLNQSSVAFISHESPYFTPKTNTAPTHALQEGPLSVSNGLLPPGMYPHDVSVPRRPPMITEESIKDYKERTMGTGIQTNGRVKDIHRHLRVVHVIGRFVQEHNELNQEDPYMQYRWYGVDKDDNKLTTTLLAIIEDSAHALIPHLYSKFTYNDAQRRDCASMEALVARVASHELFDPLTQTLRSFGIRKLIQEKMATKKKTRDRQKKREGQNILQNDVASYAAVSLVPHSDQATLTVPDLSSEEHRRSDTLDRFVSKRTEGDDDTLTMHYRGDDDIGGRGSSAKDCETGIDRNMSQSMQKDVSQQAARACVKEIVTDQLSPAREKSESTNRSTGKKKKAKKSASKRTACNVREVTASEPNSRPSDHRSNIAEHGSRNESVVNPAKSRKRKYSAKESSSSESPSNNTDSDDCEAELAELKKRMKEIEKRKTKKKGKKKRIR